MYIKEVREVAYMENNPSVFVLDSNSNSRTILKSYLEELNCCGEIKLYDDYKKALQNEIYLAKARPGVVVDISGGGIRFVTHEEIPNQDEILVVLALHSEKIDETFYILSEIVDGYQTKGITAKYVNRAKFIFDDLNEREKIVRYVFEMERYMRKKENG